MFTEVIKLVPTLDRSALSSMFENLSKRFSSVARKFGDGMKSALKFGGLAGIATALISKLVNPLQKAEEIIDRVLNKGDDAVTAAEEFQSTPGKVLRLQALGRAKGLDPETIFNLVRKFQGALAKEQEAIAAPEKIQRKLAETKDPVQRLALQAELKTARETAQQGGVLHEFINEKDIVEAFFKFSQSLSALGRTDKAQQTVAETQVFGEKVRGKAVEFLNATDFASILSKLPSAKTLDVAATKTGNLNDLKDLLTGVRETEDFVTKSTLVNETQVKALDQSTRLSDKADNQTLQRFDALKSSSIAVQELTAKFDQFTTDFLNNVAPEMVKGINVLSKFAGEFLPSFAEVKGVVIVGIDKIVDVTSDIYSVFKTIFPDSTSNGGNFVDRIPFVKSLPSVSPENLQTLQENINSFSDKVDEVTGTIESIWEEFKSSRIYRTFGGGK